MLTLKQIFLLGGIGATATAFMPSIAKAAQELFAFHMVQHLLLIAIAAPLLVASRIFDGLQRYGFIQKLTTPVAGWLLFVVIFLLWHWPTAFQWTAGHAASQFVENASILLSALFFWSVALSSRSQKWFSYGARALYVMTAAVVTDLPGVVMVFSPRAICAMPHENAALWGLTPLEDQQIAGLLMWVPANLVFFGIAMGLFALWISERPHRLVESSVHSVEVL